jgi:ribulose-bisphosphate carboxylase large chain
MDASIYCNTGGRFPFSVAQCQAINEVLRKPMGRFKPVFPVPAGGMTLEHIPQMLRDYGKDLVILIGGGLLKFKDLREGVQRFRAASHQEGKGA